MKKDNTHIPALIVILSICAFIAVLAMAIWPRDSEFEITEVKVKRSNSNTANVNSSNASGTILENSNSGSDDADNAAR